MRILYIYPHPDDESFGPAAVMAKQRREGHDVHLLTLTKGGATKVRHQLGLDIEQMGNVRVGEMEAVARRLELSGMTIHDLPDSRLKELDPRVIEEVVADEIREIEPDVIVSYAVHGVSGFHDHLVTHAVVKRVFCELRDELPRLRRFAMVTLTGELAEQVNESGGPFRLHGSSYEEIDVLVLVDDDDREANCDALRCYRSYREVIEKAGVIENRGLTYHFELFDEDHTPPLSDLFDRLEEVGTAGSRE